MINLLQGDCMDLMKGKPDKYYDLAIVDPPYGINAPNMQMGSAPNRNEKGQYPSESVAVKLKKGRLNSGSGKLKNRVLNNSDCNWDNEKPTPEYFKELFRVSKNQIIWGGNYFPLPPTRGLICWNKNQPWDNFSQFELAWTSFDCPAKLFTFSNRGGSNEETKIHPTQKPVFLYEYCLNQFAKEGFNILDTHGGSFTHAIVAYNLGFDLDIIELDQQYFNDGKARFDAHVLKCEEIKQIGFAKTAINKSNQTQTLF
jgi:site-specific DNA-methyltransferase (adenine-specific)